MDTGNNITFRPNVQNQHDRNAVVIMNSFNADLQKYQELSKQISSSKTMQNSLNSLKGKLTTEWNEVMKNCNNYSPDFQKSVQEMNKVIKNITVMGIAKLNIKSPPPPVSPPLLPGLIRTGLRPPLPPKKPLRKVGENVKERVEGDAFGTTIQTPGRGKVDILAKSKSLTTQSGIKGKVRNINLEVIGKKILHKNQDIFLNSGNLEDELRKWAPSHTIRNQGWSEINSKIKKFKEENTKAVNQLRLEFEKAVKKEDPLTKRKLDNWLQETLSPINHLLERLNIYEQSVKTIDQVIQEMSNSPSRGILTPREQMEQKRKQEVLSKHYANFRELIDDLHGARANLLEDPNRMEEVEKMRKPPASRTPTVFDEF